MTLPIQLNGVDGASGEYLVPALGVEQLSRVAQGKPLAEEDLEGAKAKRAVATFGVAYGVDPEDLAQAGWGVVFAHDERPAVREALAPLLALRKGQAGDRYLEAAGPAGHRPGESCRDFLARFKVGPGPADPAKVPYYLLVVGEPERIPFRFQFDLDLNYAVGRLCLDRPEEYAAYARSVVEAERAAPPAARRAVLFGTSNPGDRATAMSSAHLVAPLAKALPAAVKPGAWTFQTVAPADATRRTLLDGVLRGPSRPSVLFTASHGIGFPSNDPRVVTDQGGLLCQDWPGPLAPPGPIPRSHYLAASDLGDTDSLAGLVAFLFACFGAGTPHLDDFVRDGDLRRQLAPRALVAALPRRMLSLPKGGALAVIGHVDRAWSLSFDWPGAGEQVVAFQSALSAILNGGRVGAAMEAFAMRYADVAVGLNGELEDVKFGKRPDDLALATLWTASADARNYVLLGDPAVRLVPATTPRSP